MLKGTPSLILGGNAFLYTIHPLIGMQYIEWVQVSGEIFRFKLHHKSRHHNFDVLCIC